ncbi:NfeD family protein [Alkalihalobacillus sp. BA299]|uniref:NfeD family protein n=1 Tax=Alkalihalobacillus sp. BA299 TaxID=2815938 RepID=UPI001ADC6DC6|nr:NfeD family protein [Alkalihalobacillus sp. BA299]
MEVLNIASIGFLVVFLGTLFLIGELLVKAKGIFGVLGIGIMAVYFSYHIAGDTGIWVILLYILGLLLIIVDGKVISDGTIALLGIILMIVGLAVPAPNFVYGALVAMGLVLGAAASLLFLKVFPSRKLWSKMTLKDQLTGEQGYNSLNTTYKDLVGKRAKTVTPFRPIGTIEVEGKQYSATSENNWLAQETVVEVVSVDGTRIVVKKIEDE